MAVFLKEEVYHRQHTQEAQVILNVLEEIGQMAVGKMPAHQLMDGGHRCIIWDIPLGKLGADFVLVGFGQRIRQRFYLLLGIPILQGIFHHAVKWR